MGTTSNALGLKSALLSALLLLMFLGIWHIATTGGGSSAPGPAAQSLTPEQIEYLKLMGKDDNFRTADFVEFGTRFQLPESAVHHMVADLCRRAEPWIARFDEIGFEPKETQALQRAVSNRIQRLRR